MPDVIYLDFHGGRCQDTEELDSTTHIARNHSVISVAIFYVPEI